MGAMGAAISGLGASQKWLDVISNNISNSQTVAYKMGRASFSDLVSDGLRAASGPSRANNLGGLNPTQLGLGVQVSTIQVLMKQGATSVTGNVTDVAIQGSGFMTVKKGIETVYTRAGNLTFDSQGNLVTPDGGQVQGWTVAVNRTLAPPSITTPAINNSNPAAIGNIQIPNNLVLGPRATGNNASALIKDEGVIIKGNLDSRTPQNANLGGYGTPGFVPDAVSTFVVYDTLGQAYTMQMSWEQTTLLPGAPVWNFYINDITGGVPPTGANQIYAGAGVTFNFDGSLADNGNGGANHAVAFATTNGSITPSIFSLNLGTDNAASTTVPPIGLRDGVTGDYGGGSFDPITGAYIPIQTVYTDFVDGYSEGTLIGLSFDQTGGINGQFSNNQTITVAQLAMTKFTNAEGLERTGGNYFRKTANSGLGQVGTAGANGFGVIQGGALEQSNVDLTVELTNMIIAQRMFESNARVVTAADRVLDTLVNLGR